LNSSYGKDSPAKFPRVKGKGSYPRTLHRKQKKQLKYQHAIRTREGSLEDKMKLLKVIDKKRDAKYMIQGPDSPQRRVRATIKMKENLRNFGPRHGSCTSPYKSLESIESPSESFLLKKSFQKSPHLDVSPSNLKAKLYLKEYSMKKLQENQIIERAF